MIDFSKLEGHLPDNVIAELPNVINKFTINTPLRMAHFLSQCSHESGEFKMTRENLNYSEQGLKKIFPKYFPGNQALLYARKPEAIASKVYASRMGNGNENTKDGWNFRGRGFIQLTGRNNYKLFSKNVVEDIMVNPDLVATKYPLLSAAWFFSTNGINKIADAGPDKNTITLVTKRINGGTIGLDDRIKKFNIFYNILK